MPKKRSSKFHIPTKLLPSPQKIAKRGVFELLTGGKKRDYKKRVEKGGF